MTSALTALDPLRTLPSVVQFLLFSTNSQLLDFGELEET